MLGAFLVILLLPLSSLPSIASHVYVASRASGAAPVLKNLLLLCTILSEGTPMKPRISRPAASSPLRGEWICVSCRHSDCVRLLGWLTARASPSVQFTSRSSRAELRTKPSRVHNSASQRTQPNREQNVRSESRESFTLELRQSFLRQAENWSARLLTLARCRRL